MYFDIKELNEKLFHFQISLNYIYHSILKKRYNHRISKDDLLYSIPRISDSFDDREIIKNVCYLYSSLTKRRNFILF